VNARARFPASLPVRLAGLPLALRAERALHWPQARIVFVADLHLGKAASFRRLGVPVPAGSSRETLQRLSELVQATDAKRVVVLGDLLHARSSLSPALDADWAVFRNRHPRLAVALVRGNHDRSAGDPPQPWDVEVVDEGSRLGPLVLCHTPPAAGAIDGHALAGHVHPGIVIGGRGVDRLRLPCFHLLPQATVLPAFGAFTGLQVVQPARGERVVAATVDGLVEWPSSAAQTAPAPV
jgi:uncharacterized protein